MGDREILRLSVLLGLDDLLSFYLLWKKVKIIFHCCSMSAFAL